MQRIDINWWYIHYYIWAFPELFRELINKKKCKQQTTDDIFPSSMEKKNDEWQNFDNGGAHGQFLLVFLRSEGQKKERVAG